MKNIAILLLLFFVACKSKYNYEQIKSPFLGKYFFVRNNKSTNETIEILNDSTYIHYYKNDTIMHVDTATFYFRSLSERSYDGYLNNFKFFYNGPRIGEDEGGVVDYHFVYYFSEKEAVISPGGDTDSYDFVLKRNK